MTLVESTGGNTGIGLAFTAAVRGYRLILTMPESMSTERVALLRHLGAQVVLTPGILMGEAVAEAHRIAAETPGAVLLNQFANPANPEVHRRTTAPEIWEDTGGSVDMFVCAVGIGGTITGVGEVLKARNPAVRVVAVEPAGAAVLSGHPAGGSPARKGSSRASLPVPPRTQPSTSPPAPTQQARLSSCCSPIPASDT
jgi:cysteine synthase